MFLKPQLGTPVHKANMTTQLEFDRWTLHHKTQVYLHASLGKFYSKNVTVVHIHIIHMIKTLPLRVRHIITKELVNMTTSGLFTPATFCCLVSTIAIATLHSSYPVHSYLFSPTGLSWEDGADKTFLSAAFCWLSVHVLLVCMFWNQNNVSRQLNIFPISPVELTTFCNIIMCK